MKLLSLLLPLVQITFLSSWLVLVQGAPVEVHLNNELALPAGGHSSQADTFVNMPESGDIHYTLQKRSLKSTVKKIIKSLFHGDGTYYTPGLGSCGTTNTEKQLIAALNAAQMGTYPNPNKNPHCGRYANVKGPKGSVKVKIVDTCPSCSSGDLDLSPTAFEKIAELAQGRVDISWSWAT